MWEEYSLRQMTQFLQINGMDEGKKKGGNVMGTGMDLRVVWPSAEYGS